MGVRTLIPCGRMFLIKVISQYMTILQKCFTYYLILASSLSLDVADLFDRFLSFVDGHLAIVILVFL